MRSSAFLASIAIPAYQDYSIRAKISESLVAAAPFKVAVGTFYETNSDLPRSRTESGQGNIITRYIEEVTITAAGFISININEDETGVSGQTADNMFVIVEPVLKTGAIAWKCYADNAVDGSGDNINLIRFIPSSCR